MTQLNFLLPYTPDCGTQIIYIFSYLLKWCLIWISCLFKCCYHVILMLLHMNVTLYLYHIVWNMQYIYGIMRKPKALYLNVRFIKVGDIYLRYSLPMRILYCMGCQFQMHMKFAELMFWYIVFRNNLISDTCKTIFKMLRKVSKDFLKWVIIQLHMIFDFLVDLFFGLYYEHSSKKVPPIKNHLLLMSASQLAHNIR